MSKTCPDCRDRERYDAGWGRCENCRRWLRPEAKRIVTLDDCYLCPKCAKGTPPATDAEIAKYYAITLEEARAQYPKCARATDVEIAHELGAPLAEVWMQYPDAPRATLAHAVQKLLLTEAEVLEMWPELKEVKP